MKILLGDNKKGTNKGINCQTSLWQFFLCEDIVVKVYILCNNDAITYIQANAFT